MVKTTPDSDDYVKSGVYKVNQSFRIVDATPQNGHYQIYYKKGLYYVDAKNVKLSMSNVKKPLIGYIAKVNTNGSDAALIESKADGGKTVAKAKDGASIDVLEKDFGGGYSKIWFNSKECYIKTESLTDFQETPSAGGIAQLGSPIGTIVLDTPWSEWGTKTYSAEAFAMLAEANYGNGLFRKVQKIEAMEGAVAELSDREWVNVYKVEDFSCYADGDYPDPYDLAYGKIYTVLHGGEIRHIVQFRNKKETFTYYPGSGYAEQTVAKTQDMYVDTEKYSALAYNINGNNYFKLRDVTDALDCRVEWDSRNQLIKVYTSLSAYVDPNEPVG